MPRSSSNGAPAGFGDPPTGARAGRNYPTRFPAPPARTTTRSCLPVPHAFDRIYLMDVRIQISDDGGKTFRGCREATNTATTTLWPSSPTTPTTCWQAPTADCTRALTSRQHGATSPNLPVTQFYKVALDDREPFYIVYGGTQDNSTQGGPSRTDIATASEQRLVRHPLRRRPPTGRRARQSQHRLLGVATGQSCSPRPKTGEIVYIQPQPEPGDPAERFNWDAPILISPHSPTRLYFASQRVWRSDDRGDSWRPISGDLTRDQDRCLLPLMGRSWSYDSPGTLSPCRSSTPSPPWQSHPFARACSTPAPTTG